MGVSYNWDADAGTVEVTGVCCDDDLGTATIQINAMMREMKRLSSIEDPTDEEYDQLNILEQFINMKEDTEKNN